MSSFRCRGTCSPLDTPVRLGTARPVRAPGSFPGGYMTRSSSTRPTALPTGRSAPLILVAMSLEQSGRFYRLKVAGAPLRGDCEVHEWRFAADGLTPGILDEVGATMDMLAVSSLLMALGMTQQLSFELDRASEST